MPACFSMALDHSSKSPWLIAPGIKFGDFVRRVSRRGLTPITLATARDRLLRAQ